MLSKEKIAWLQLARSSNVGPITFHVLLERYGTAENALRKISSSFSRIKIPNLAVIEEELDSIAKINGQLIYACDPEYPELLTTLKDRPPVITVLGNTQLLKDEKNIAIVGARNCSYSGSKFAREISYDLAQKGFTIISGLAIGIDTAAHHVINKNLPTIAVVANGINVVYPQENNLLHDKIIKNGGLVITEFPYGANPKQKYFPQRNRLISGLSLGVVVVEAGVKSGSLISLYRRVEKYLLFLGHHLICAVREQIIY